MASKLNVIYEMISVDVIDVGTSGHGALHGNPLDHFINDLLLVRVLAISVLHLKHEKWGY